MKLRVVAFLAVVSISLFAPLPVYAGRTCGGAGYPQIETSIDFGCKKIGSPITDLLFALLRFLAVGVGIIITGSLVWAGIQYIFSQDDPSAVSAAKNRILHTIIALLIYIFAYAILNFLIPGGFFV